MPMTPTPPKLTALLVWNSSRIMYRQCKRAVSLSWQLFDGHELNLAGETLETNPFAKAPGETDIMNSRPSGLCLAGFIPFVHSGSSIPFQVSSTYKKIVRKASKFRKKR